MQIAAFRSRNAYEFSSVRSGSAKAVPAPTIVAAQRRIRRLIICRSLACPQLRATVTDAPRTGSAISPRRRCQKTLRSLSSPFASARHSLSDNRSLRFYRCRGPLVLTGARKNGPSSAHPHLVDRTTGCRLVLTPGVCHVAYRTVLLSQFGGRSAYDRQTPGRRAGPAAEGEGASDGGRTSSQGRLAARRLPP